MNQIAIDFDLELVQKVSINNKKKKRSSQSTDHVRSGKPDEWKTYVSKKHYYLI